MKCFERIAHFRQDGRTIVLVSHSLDTIRGMCRDAIWIEKGDLRAYGPSDDVERGPWGGVVVRGPRSVEEFRKIDPRLNQAIEHMNELPTERMLRAVKKLLAERAAA